jgi:predicted nucleic acid-binding protein
MLRKRVHKGQLSEKIAGAAASAALGPKGIEYIDSPALHLRAREIACQLGLLTAYDARYLALAEQHSCEF